MGLSWWTENDCWHLCYDWAYIWFCHHRATQRKIWIQNQPTLPSAIITLKPQPGGIINTVITFTAIRRIIIHFSTCRSRDWQKKVQATQWSKLRKWNCILKLLWKPFLYCFRVIFGPINLGFLPGSTIWGCKWKSESQWQNHPLFVSGSAVLHFFFP